MVMVRSPPFAFVAFVAFVALAAAAFLPTSVTGFAPLFARTGGVTGGRLTVRNRHHAFGTSESSPKPAQATTQMHMAVTTTQRRLSTRWDKLWWTRFDELQRYKDLHGDCNVPRGWSRNPPLANWVGNQRQQYQRLISNDPEKTSRMTEERIIALESIGFEWVLGTLTEWETRFDELLQYKKEHGDCDVPQTWSENPPLGSWVNKQRREYWYRQEGKPSQITEERIAALDSIGFVWALFTQTEWETRFDELLQYKKEHGDCNVPVAWSENPPLGSWVNTQRRDYGYRQEGKPSFITEERIAALDSVGFVWKVHTEWETRFDELLQYKNEHSDCNVPQGWSENPQLGRWVSKQREQYRYRQEGKPSSMTRERLNQLESIGFKWKLRRRRKKE